MEHPRHPIPLPFQTHIPAGLSCSDHQAPHSRDRLMTPGMSQGRAMACSLLFIEARPLKKPPQIPSESLMDIKGTLAGKQQGTNRVFLLKISLQAKQAPDPFTCRIWPGSSSTPESPWIPPHGLWEGCPGGKECCSSVFEDAEPSQTWC